MNPALDKQPAWQVSPANGKYFVNSVAVSADGSRVVGGTFHHIYGEKESRRGPAQPAVAGPNNASPENGTYGVYCYNATGQLQWKDEFEGWQGVYWVALSADGSRAAAGGFMSSTMPQGFLRIYDASTGLRLFSQQVEQRVNQVAFSADGRWLVANAGTLRLYRALSVGYEQTDDYMPNHTMGIVSAQISADGGTVVCSDFAGLVRLFSNVNGKLTQRAQWTVPGGKRGDFCHMLDLAADGKCFAGGGANGLFYFFDVAKFIATGQPTCSYDTKVYGAVYGVAVAGDGSRFAGVVNDGPDAGKAYVVPVVNGAAGQPLVLSVDRNPNCVVLNATHSLCAIATGHPDGKPGYYYLFDATTGAQRWNFQTGNMSWPIAVAANGSAVVAGSDDSYIYYFTP
jgi:WD40 repeat protein